MARRPEPALRTRALQCLARREYSRAELRAKLLPHVRDGDDVEAVLDDLAKRNWQSDERAAEQVVNQRRNRFGTQRITHELRQKGVAENLIAEALPQLKATELEAAREVWQKKFSSLPQNPNEKARQIRFLQSRGFSLEVALKTIKPPQISGAEHD
ncbi:MAG: regulatory protein [Gallionellaceae bacterium]|nr:MAG: regulatory protein [Gallionellaceae bacterium]